MEKKAGNVMSGLGGAAILALFLSPAGLSTSKSPPNAPDNKAPQVRVEENTKPLASDSPSGPWSAICEEYATDFDRGTKHLTIPTGALAHKSPPEAEDDAVEYVKHVQMRPGITIDQKFQVRAHPVGDVVKCTKGQKDIEVLITTIPDPLASHLALYFDRDIEALEKAAALSGFSISHYWLPWDPANNPGGIGTDPTRLAEWKSRAQEPGILVFHNGKSQRLIMFLVGETPTTGVQRIQFGHALWYAQELTSVANPHSLEKPAAVTLKIVGPHFSSSLLGMREVISDSEIVSTDSTLHILSPYASSGTLIRDFKDGLGLNDAPSQIPHYPGSWFVSLKSSGDDQEKAAFCYLNSLGYDASDIAFIEEDESAFSVASQKSSDDSNKDKSNKYVHCQNPWGSDKDKDQSRDDLLRLKYPRDLSSLRNKTDILAPTDAEINGVKLPFWNIPVALGEKAHVVLDSPPAFAADQEASRIDHALQVIVARLRQHKIRAVVIDASNNLDTLFLLEYFLRNLPNLRFATEDADEFEIGRLQDTELTGTLSITDLPLLRDSLQIKTNDRISFASGDSEATYMAASLLTDSAITFSSLKHRVPSECATSSIVGRSGFILMTPQTKDLSFPCIGWGQETARLLVRPESQPNSDKLIFFGSEETEGANVKSVISRSWSILLLIVVTASYIHLACLHRAGISRSDYSTHCRQLKCSYPADCGIYEAERLSMLFALNSQYLLLNFFLATTTISLSNLYQWRGFGGITAVAILASLFFCCGANCLLIYQCVRRLRFRKYLRPLAISMFYLIATLAMWSEVLWGFRDANPINISYNALRIALYPEGVSPLMPLLVISVAYIVYATVELSGINWAARRRISLGFTPDTEKTLYHLHRRLQRRLNPFPRQAVSTVVVAFAAPIVFGTAFNLSDSLSGFDGPYFKYWFLLFGFGASLLITTFTVLRAWSIWRKLKDILHWLRETGLQPAFSSLHQKDLPKLRIWDLGKREQDLTIHAKTVDALRDVSGDEAAQYARLRLDAIRTAQVQGLQHSCEDAQALSNQLNEPMDRALAYLSKMPDDCGQFGKSCQHYLALRFVALIRYSLLHIRNLYTFVVYGFSSLAICVASYPFEGKSNLSALLAMLFVFILLSIALMFAQIQRDPILSAVEGSDAGRVSYLELAKHLVSIGGVPALIVLATQFPALGQVVLSWAKPVLDLVK